MGHVGSKVLTHFCTLNNIFMLFLNGYQKRCKFFVVTYIHLSIQIFRHFFNRRNKAFGQKMG